MAIVDTFCSQIASWRDIMGLSKNRLKRSVPRRFPVGAKYVVEGHGGAEGHLRVVARYIELPGGRRINISGSQTLSFDRSRGSQTLRTQPKIRGGTTSKKFAGRRGTPARASR
jgi:hypothetical protein